MKPAVKLVLPDIENAVPGVQFVVEDAGHTVYAYVNESTEFVPVVQQDRSDVGQPEIELDPARTIARLLQLRSGWNGMVGNTEILGSVSIGSTPEPRVDPATIPPDPEPPVEVLPHVADYMAEKDKTYAQLEAEAELEGAAHVSDPVPTPADAETVGGGAGDAAAPVEASQVVEPDPIPAAVAEPEPAVAAPADPAPADPVVEDEPVAEAPASAR